MPASRGSGDRDGRVSLGARSSRRGLSYHCSGYVVLPREASPRSTGCGPVSGRASWAPVTGLMSWPLPGGGANDFG